MKQVKNNWKHNWKKILSAVCAVVLLVQTVISSPSMFVRAADADALSIAITGGSYSATYAQAENETQAQATAIKLVQAVVDETTSTTGTYPVSISGTPSLNLTAAGGTYSFAVAVDLGNSEILTVQELSMSIAARPEPVKVVFDSDEKVTAAGFSTWNVTYTKSFKNDGGKKYMHLNVTPTDNFSQLIYYSFLSQSQGKYAMSTDAYPYMKISYRRDIKSTDSEGRLDIQASTDTADDNADFECGMNYYKLDANEQPYWEEMVVDMRSLSAEYFVDEGENGERNMTPVSGSWTGITQNQSNWEPLRMYFTRHNTKDVATTFDVEYIAFFGSKEEADAYPLSLDLAADMEALGSANFTCVAGEGSTEAQAKATLVDQIAALGIKSAYTVITVNYVEPTDQVDGSYAAKVVFSEDYSTTVTMTIEKKAVKVVWSFNSNAIVTRLTSWNAKLTYEDGLVKMTTKDTMNGDGYYFDLSFTEDEKFEASKLPYFKIKYKISDAGTYPLQFRNTINGKTYYRQFNGNISGNAGQWITMILNLSETQTGINAVTIKNLATQNETHIAYTGMDANIPTSGTVTGLNFKLARDFSATVSNFNPSAEIEYIGFFATYEEAAQYEGAAQEEIKAAEEYLTKNTINIGWGDGNTEAKAMKEVTAVVENCGVGATISNAVYDEPTTEKQGTLTFDVTLQSGTVSKTLTGLIAYINKKASKPIMWRFNTDAMLTGLTEASVKLKVEDNVLKMTSTDPINADGFYFMADTAKLGEQFYLQDYPYIQIKYKRNIASVAQIYFYSDALTGDPSLGSGLGYGPQNNTWYTTTIDTSAKNIGDTSTYNYNHDTEKWENKVRDRSNSAVTSDFVGLSTKFRFNFGRWKYLDRTAEIEYIAFFPTLEDANAYAGSEAQEQERLISNAQVALADYSLPTVSYYDGCTKDYAAETAEDLLQSQVGDEVVVKVKESTTDTYSAPTLKTTDGEYKFTATIYDTKGNELYKTEQYTLSISREPDTTPVVFTFANPNFVNERVEEVDTTVATAKDYEKMSLAATSGNAGFTLALNSSEKFHMSGLSYIVLQASDENLTLLLNEKELSLGNISSGTKAVIDGRTGEIYLNGAKQNTVLSIGELERITSLGMKAGDTDTEVTYIGFFATLEEAKSYMGESTVLNHAVNELKSASLSCAYSDAKTEPYAKLYIEGKIKETVGEGVSVVETTKKVFEPASKNGTGSITVTALLSAGSESDTHYQEVEVTMTIGKQPSGPIVWSFAGTSFDGLTANYNAQISYTGTALKIVPTNAATEGGVGFKVNLTENNKFYIQDYPYVKIKMKGTTASTKIGRDLMYITTDEASEHYTQFNFFSRAKGVSASAIIDTTEELLTVCDVENNTVLSNTMLNGKLTYHGRLQEISFQFGRDIATDKTMEVEYVAFFSTREEAESYNWDYCYDGYTFNGVEYAESMATVSEAPKTIEAGIRIPKGTNTAMTIASNSQFSLETTADGNVKFVYGSNDILISTGVKVYDGMWHHVAVTLTDNKAVLYVDNKQAAENTAFELSDYTASSVLVAKGNEKGLKGTVYYVRLFSNAKTQIELSKNAFNPVCDDTDVLAGWFMDELSSDKQFMDVYGTNPLKLTDNYGKDGHEFLGNDYIKVSKKLAKYGSNMTFEFWLKMDEECATGTYTILSNEGGNTWNSTTSIKVVDGKLQFTYRGTAMSSEQVTVADGIWKHIAFVADQTNGATWYVDGEQIYSNDWNLGKHDSTVNCTYYIGASPLNTSTELFKGSLSDVRIWSDVRTQDEIKNNMSNYPTGSEANLLASWRLDTQDKLVYTDSSSNKNDGKLYSDGWYKLENITGAYTIAQVGDTQDYFVETANVAAQPMKMLEFYEGVAKNIDRFNLVHFMHAGDVTQYNTPTEWNYARQAYDYIAGKLQYTIAIGNHDYPTPSSGIGAEYRDAEHYNAAFPLSTIEKEANVTTEYSAEKFAIGTYGGAYKENASENVYTYLKVGDVEYIIFAIEFGPSDDVLNWVSSVLNATENQSKQAIITTHCYFSQWGDLTVYDAQNCGDDFKETANDGVDIWKELLSKHDNISLITSGHSQNSQLIYKVSETEKNTDVVQLIADHSAAAKAFPSQEGLMLLMAFSEDGKTMHTYYYSPFYDAFYDTDNEVTFEIKNKATGNTAPKTNVEYYEDISRFRTEGNYTAPECEVAGYIFSGWYTDAECKTALATTTTSGKAYAKFVKEDILTVKAQVGVDDNGKVPMDSSSVRFVTTVDSRKYQEVAFMVSIQNGATYTAPYDTAEDESSKHVYRKLYALDGSGKTIEYDPTVFNSSSLYFKAWSLGKIPASAYSTKIKVTPYWITLDGTKVLGRTSIKTIQSFVNRINNKAVETTPLIQD